MFVISRQIVPGMNNSFSKEIFTRVNTIVPLIKFKKVTSSWDFWIRHYKELVTRAVDLAICEQYIALRAKN